MSESLRAEQIRRRMAQIRTDLHDDVDVIVETARVMADWRHYWSSYPWACLAAAAAVGYLVVPTKVQIVQPDMQTVLDLARRHQLSVQPIKDASKRSGIAGAIFRMAAPAIMRGAVALASSQAAKFAQRRAANASGNGAPR